MAIPRCQLIDLTLTSFYHCISRCVRQAFLCGGESQHRKAWIEKRLQELVGIFAIDCGGYAVMDNHLHVLLRIDATRAEDWSAEEVARRWCRLFPIRTIANQALEPSESWIKKLIENPAWVAKTRSRLRDLGWFMKCLKEPLARAANKEDGCKGAFWEARFKSVAVLDEESLLAVSAYIDLNPLAAGIAPTPEESPHTSFKARVEQCKANNATDTLRDDLSTLTSDPRQEEGIWLMPVEDRREQGASRPGLIAGLTLSCYLRVVDATARLVREGKARLDEGVASIFDRLKIAQADWESTILHLFLRPTERGRYLGTRPSISRLRERLGTRRAVPRAT